MLHGRINTQRSIVGRVTGTIFRTAIVAACFSAIGEVVLGLTQGTCIVSCMVSVALAWASHVAAYSGQWIAARPW